MAGDIEGSAVVNRDADHREADGNVDAAVAVDRLERHVALVVIAGDDHLPLPANGGWDQCVSWNGAVSVDASRTGSYDRWLEDVGVLVTEDTILAGTTPARMIEIISPAGLEKFFRDIADLVEAEDPTPEDIAALATTYGVQFEDPAWLPDLIKRYNLNA
jgi:hypothetical protein